MRDADEPLEKDATIHRIVISHREDGRHEVGPAVARFSGLDCGRCIPAAPAPGPADRDVSVPLVEDVDETLSARCADWPVTRAAVVTAGSVSRPLPVARFGDRIATIERLPFAGTVPDAGPSRSERSNSAFRLTAVFSTYTLPSEMMQLLAGEISGKPLFLLSDYADSGWTPHRRGTPARRRRDWVRLPPRPRHLG